MTELNHDRVELAIDELDGVSVGDDKAKNDPPAKLPEDPVVTVIKVLGGVIWFL